MRVIDLLNKIANGEAPKKIRFASTYWYRRNGVKNVYYFSENDDEDLYVYLFRHILSSTLNDEVEIIEEEKKIPEKLDIYWELQKLIKDNNIDEHNLHKLLTKIVIKINEIIDYLKSKGE